MNDAKKVRIVLAMIEAALPAIGSDRGTKTRCNVGSIPRKDQGRIQGDSRGFRKGVSRMKLTIRYTAGDPPRERIEEIQAVSIAYDGRICRIEAVMPEVMIWRIHGSSDATLWQRIKRFIPFLCLAFVLAGCDYSSNIPTASDFDTGPTTWVCWNYTVPLADTTMYTTQDSTKLCDDGTSPILFEATWISTDDWCTSMPETVVGGLKGIRRRFACRKQNVMHETQRKVVGR